MKQAGNWFEVIKDDLNPMRAGTIPLSWMSIDPSGGKTCCLYRVHGESGLLNDIGLWT
jgi:hypothetical protein